MKVWYKIELIISGMPNTVKWVEKTRHSETH